MQAGWTRRALAAGAAGAAFGVWAAAAAQEPAQDRDPIAEDLARYAGFGWKRSGGAGERAAADWIESRLRELGFACRRERLAVPLALDLDAPLAVEGALAKTIAVAAGPLAKPLSLAGPLVRLETAQPGQLALAELPFARHSSFEAPMIAAAIKQAQARKTAALILVTHGPTREAIALNAAAEAVASPPIVCLAPKDAAPFLAACAQAAAASLTIPARPMGETANLYATLKRGPKWLAVSTPRTGWFDCAGERGPGVAIFLEMARWAAGGRRDHSLFFACTGGHEYENAGTPAMLAAAPPPAETALWVHLGAGLAAADWHELGERLLPLPSADPQRFLLASPSLLEGARAGFKGLPGLERVYPAEARAPGEIGPITGHGFKRILGGFGAHRFHHTAADSAEKTSAALVRPVAAAFIATAQAALTA